MARFPGNPPGRSARVAAETSQRERHAGELAMIRCGGPLVGIWVAMRGPREVTGACIDLSLIIKLKPTYSLIERIYSP
jgi:hypothetical protein